MRSNSNVNRRNFLQYLGKTGVAAHALRGSSLLAGLMVNRYAHAQKNVKRVVFVYTPLGAPDGYWLPKGQELNSATKAFEGLQSVCHFHEVMVVNGGQGLLRKTLGELRWTKDWTADTIDHQIGKVIGNNTPFNTLHFGVQTRGAGRGNESISFKNMRDVATMDQPAEAYRRLFGGPGGASPAHFQPDLQKQNVLDAHLQSIHCSRSKLSSEEQVSIEQYENTLSILSAKLMGAAISPEACLAPAWNKQGLDAQAEAAAYGPGNFTDQAYLQSELICHALACGLTNVVTLQLSDGLGAFIGHDTKIKNDLHSASHTDRFDYIEMVNYLGRCQAYLIKQLAECDDPAVPGTKLLDNTVVVCVNSEGDGTDHTPRNGPNIIATRMPAFKTGLATPQASTEDTNLKVLQSVAVGLGLEQYIGKESHHCIWPCGKGVNETLLS